MRQRQGAEFCLIPNAGVPQALAKWMRQRQEPNFAHSQRQRLRTQFGPSLTLARRRVISSTSKSPQNAVQRITLGEQAYPEIIFRFGVLQLRLHRIEGMHLEVVASEVGYLNILQGRVCALFILQAKAVRIALLQFGLHWLKVHEFSLVELRAS